MLKKLYDNGILIVAGTDGGDAFALEHELELYVGAGIPPLNALQCATYNAAKDCSLLNDYGTISAGKPADMILVDGNPAVTIGDIRHVEWVIKNDRQFYPKKLFASIGWSYYY
jgi:imidazolonepropionase-like amidohydrolase